MPGRKQAGVVAMQSALMTGKGSDFELLRTAPVSRQVAIRCNQQPASLPLGNDAHDDTANNGQWWPNRRHTSLRSNGFHARSSAETARSLYACLFGCPTRFAGRNLEEAKARNRFLGPPDCCLAAATATAMAAVASATAHFPHMICVHDICSFCAELQVKWPELAANFAALVSVGGGRFVEHIELEKVRCRTFCQKFSNFLVCSLAVLF